MITQIGWRPGIGDPTFMGWLTVLVYYLVAVLYFACAWRFKRAFWWLAGGLLLALGLIKQFNFLTLFTDIGRVLATQGGWYEMRRPLQLSIIFVLLIAAVAVLAIIAFRMRAAGPAYLLALAALYYMLAFVLVRSVSLHMVDAFINFRLAGLRMNWILELGGLFMAGLPAYRLLRGQTSTAQTQAAQSGS